MSRVAQSRGTRKGTDVKKKTNFPVFFISLKRTVEKFSLVCFGGVLFEIAVFGFVRLIPPVKS